MNLADTLKALELEAGGPGSGRKPAGGRQSNSGFSDTISNKRSAYLTGKHWDAKENKGSPLSDSERAEVVHHIRQGNLSYNSKTGGLNPGSGKSNSRTQMVNNFKKDEGYVG